MASVIRVVLTGGPCGGKTSALKALQAIAVERGLQVYIVPETPSLIISSGFPYPGETDPAFLLDFETGLANAQLAIEGVIAELARARAAALGYARPAVLLMDRSLIDMSGYMSADVWAALLIRLGLAGGGDATYKSGIRLVLHFKTAADGALSAYTRGNNAARTETPEQARQMDAAVWRAYEGHPRRILVDNPSEGGFDAKLATAIAAFRAVLDEALVEESSFDDASSAPLP